MRSFTVVKLNYTTSWLHERYITIENQTRLNRAPFLTKASLTTMRSHTSVFHESVVHCRD